MDNIAHLSLYSNYMFPVRAEMNDSARWFKVELNVRLVSSEVMFIKERDIYDSIMLTSKWMNTDFARLSFEQI